MQQPIYKATADKTLTHYQPVAKYMAAVSNIDDVTTLPLSFLAPSQALCLEKRSKGTEVEQ